MHKPITTIAAAILLTGCVKTACQKCTQTITTSVSKPTAGYPQTTSSDYYVCDDDLAAMKKRNGQTTVTQSGSVTVTSKEQIICK